MPTPVKPPKSAIQINPYWVGGKFLDYCAAQGWMVKQREGRTIRYYCTPAGCVALRQFGIDVVPAAQRGRRREKRPG